MKEKQVHTSNMHMHVSNQSFAKPTFTPSTDATYSLSDPESWEIIKLLQDFSRVVKRAAENYDPSLIAKYAINLAQAFNKYYAHTRILDESPERESRLALSYSTAVVLKEALRFAYFHMPNALYIFSWNNYSQIEKKEMIDLPINKDFFSLNEKKTP